MSTTTSIREKMRVFTASHLPLIGFSVFLFLSSVALITFQSIALKQMKDRNERILSHYNQILSVSPETKDTGALDVGVYIKEFKLTPAQSLAFQDYTKKLVETAVTQSQVDIEVNSIVEAKSAAMYQETKDLLEMQFAKIQHETESLQIWCGILTVVFLIFSFYSLFKTDELVQQGREGVKELSDLQAKGDEKIRTFDTNSAQAIQQMKNKAIEERSRIIEEITRKKNDISNQITQELLKANEALDKKYQDLSSSLDSQAKAASVISQKEENELLKQAISRLESLALRVDELQRQITQRNG